MNFCIIYQHWKTVNFKKSQTLQAQESIYIWKGTYATYIYTYILWIYSLLKWQQNVHLVTNIKNAQSMQSIQIYYSEKHYKNVIYNIMDQLYTKQNSHTV